LARLKAALNPAVALSKKDGKKSAAAAATWALVQTPCPRSASMLLDDMALRTLCRKLFALNLRAYEAYRSYCMLYSVVQPADIYDVSRLDLDVVAGRFGLASAPLLDLRTKANHFRPQTDFMRAAVQQHVQQQRAFREYAVDHIQPEAPVEY
jgi:hypothetical protein